MAPIIKVSNNVLEGLDKLGINYSLKQENKIPIFKEQDFIYVPLINLYVAKERKLLSKNWFDTHKGLQSQEEKMLTIPEFVEFLKYAKTNFPEIYNDITEVRSPWRAEWLDADFKVKNDKLYINYNHILDKNGNLVPQNSKVLDKNTLMKDKIPGISLEDWLDNPSKQGLPTKKTKSGDLYYWCPRSDNNSVARFDAFSSRANLNCDGDPSNRDSNFGVRAAKQRE